MATKSAQPKSTTRKSAIAAATETVATAVKPAQDVVKLPNEVTTVTSHKLKRTFIHGAYLGKLYLETDDYTWLSVQGLQSGLAWDEVVRAGIQALRASSDPQSTIKTFAPALNM